MTNPRRAPNDREAIRDLKQFVTDQFEAGEMRSMLDAGCGYALPFEFPPDLRIVGLDASPEALAKNEYIDSAIVGDVETYELPTEAFDAVLCWTVLEHLSNPRAAVANMSRALRPGGLLIVGLPNLWSLKGMLTKLTPFSFHVWVYRHVWGFESAGTPGFGPYPTHLRREIGPNRLVDLARREGLERIYASTYRLDLHLPRSLDVLWSTTVSLVRIVTLGRWDPGASEHVAVFRKLGAGR